MKLVTSVIQLKSGILISFIPGARRLMMVVMKFTPPAIELIPRIESPTTQKATFSPGEYWVDVRFE